MTMQFKFRYYFLFFARLVAIIIFSLLLATYVNKDTYEDFYSKRLVRVHTSDLQTLAAQMKLKLEHFLAIGDQESVQSVLDASFGLFGYVVTDCIGVDRLCPEQKIVYMSSPTLPWVRKPVQSDLVTGSFTPLTRNPGVKAHSSNDIVGRLYVINNMPHSFTSDYLEMFKAPFEEIGVRRFYLRNIAIFFSGSFIIWFFFELYLLLRRRERKVLLSREFELKQAVNRQMKLLSEKDAHITRLNEDTNRQYENYVASIKELNKKISDEEEYGRLAEEIIAGIEEDKSREISKYAEELITVRGDMQRLQEKITIFEEGVLKKGSEPTYRALEEAVRTPNFSNLFEENIFKMISSSDQYKKGEWRLLSNFDVAPGRNYRQFTDFLLFNGDAIIIIEAKYYLGTIDSPGDFLNDIWISMGQQRKRIDSLWGENPYHQINEYSMSLMKILKQKSPWMFQIFGIILFPDEADITKVGDHLGKFYRVAKLSSSIQLFEKVFADAHRFQSAKNPNRPKADQVEGMLRGRKITT